MKKNEAINRLARLRGISLKRTITRCLITGWCLLIPFVHLMVKVLSEMPKVPQI